MTEKKKTAPATRIHPDQLSGLGPHSGGGEPDAIEIPEAPREESATGIVASGRCLHVPDGTRHVAGYDTERRVNTHRQGFKEVLAGQAVTLPISEIARLRELGFLVDPNKVATDEEARTISALPRDATPTPGLIGNNGKT
jgi:hypothetical protein